MSSPEKRQYPPVSDYAYISDCQSSALISQSGSIDWCCMPRIDSASCFGRLLDWDNGGYCRIFPAAECEVSRRYLDRTLILETTYRTGTGEVRLLDFFPMREGGRHKPYHQILRILEGIRGEMELELEIAPCFDYGAICPWIVKRREGF
ncbi:MAG TPA: trehalase-like domain-containing protein, partial [Desulfuromonadales bacterium]|nr:trehalase-like domain-containing protein [Desulfuromonadales bacterium]